MISILEEEEGDDMRVNGGGALLEAAVASANGRQRTEQEGGAVCVCVCVVCGVAKQK